MSDRVSNKETAAAQARSAGGNRSNTKRRDRAVRSIDDALSLVDLSNRASFIEDLLFYRSDDGSKIERPTEDDPLAECDADYDAYLLLQQLLRPIDHVAELLRLLQLAMGDRLGHLTPADQRLMRMPHRLWAGVYEISNESIVGIVLRLGSRRLDDWEIQRVTGAAYRIVKIAQDFVRRAEAARLAVTKGRPLSDLAEVGKRNWYGVWSLVEPPGPHNEPWNEGSV